MEAIGTIILLVIGWAIFQWLLSAGSRTVGAAAKAVVGKGSFSENMEIAFKGMMPLEIRLNDKHLGNDGSGPLAKEIEGKGLFPLSQPTRVGFITSVFDKTSGEFEPVLSAIEAFQEPNSTVYQHRIEAGKVTPDQGFVRWARLGVILPELLQPPYGGRRDMVAILRMVDLDNPPAITHGFHEPNHNGILWQQSLEFSYTFNEKGYKEAAEHRDEARAIALKIGMAVAMADGLLKHSEGETLKEWIVRAIEPFSDEKQKTLKTLYNDAMKEAYAAAKSADLSLSALTQRLNEIGEKTTKYETVELCFDVMAADGVADAEEMKTIRKVAEALELDLGEIERIRDQKIIGLDTTATNHAGIEDILGIEPGWDKDHIRKYLRTEFQKWNNRLNTLSEGEERNNAQRMLDIIAEARKKYV